MMKMSSADEKGGGRERRSSQRMANADPYDDESNKTTVSIDLRLLDSTFISFIHK